MEKFNPPSDKPDLLPIRISANNAIDHWGLASFGVKIVLANRVNLDVFRVIDVDEFLVNIRTIRAWVIQRRVKIT